MGWSNGSSVPLPSMAAVKLRVEMVKRPRAAVAGGNDAVRQCEGVDLLAHEFGIEEGFRFEGHAGFSLREGMRGGKAILSFTWGEGKEILPFATLTGP